MHWVKSFIARLALLALGVVAFVLATENSDPVVLRLLEFESEAWPISWWIVLSFFCWGVGWSGSLKCITLAVSEVGS